MDAEQRCAGAMQKGDASPCARRGEALAHVCITVIGVGYLFPIAAIWAAFDYWKLLFPGRNIEFSASIVYQVGSIFTVGALSLSRSLALRRRILLGFAGQFVCLGVILAFRWLALPQGSLFVVLLTLIALCAVATGHLDSALLSLCSQYSSRMQQHLQIGIGMGLLASVLYRDLTKVLFPGAIADATSVFFVVALVTILVCVASYELLMSLPVSARVRETPAVGGEPLLSEERGADAPEPRRPVEEGAVAHVAAVWRAVWRNQLAICAHFALCTTCYPGLVTSVPCRQLTALQPAHWFQELLLTAFSTADVFGRFLTGRRFGLHHGNILITVALRLAIFPLLLHCIASPSATDALSWLVVAATGFSNGYCLSLALVVVNEVPGLSDEQRKTCGRISACSASAGLLVGALAAAVVAEAVGGTGA